MPLQHRRERLGHSRREELPLRRQCREARQRFPSAQHRCRLKVVRRWCIPVSREACAPPCFMKSVRASHRMYSTESGRTRVIFTLQQETLLQHYCPQILEFSSTLFQRMMRQLCAPMLWVPGYKCDWHADLGQRWVLQAIRKLHQYQCLIPFSSEPLGAEACVLLVQLLRLSEHISTRMKAQGSPGRCCPCARATRIWSRHSPTRRRCQ